MGMGWGWDGAILALLMSGAADPRPLRWVGRQAWTWRGAGGEEEPHGGFLALSSLLPQPLALVKNQKNVNQEMLEVSSKGRAANPPQGWMQLAKKCQVVGFFFPFPHRKLDLSFEMKLPSSQ